MANLTIHIDSHKDPTYTVSQMRKRLAQVLSKLNGDQVVSFSFAAVLEGYQPAPTTRQVMRDEEERQMPYVPADERFLD
jgi:hypothetical protein